MPRFLRSLPAVLAAVLLVLAASSPYSHTTPQRAASGAAATSTSACGGTLQSGDSTAALPWGMDVGVTQPLLPSDNLAGLTLYENTGGYTYTWLTHRVVVWDPVALAPNPVTVALRTVDFNISTYGIMTMSTSASYWPALVRRQLAGVAEAMPATLALDLQCTGWSSFNTPTAQEFQAAGAANVPAALQYAGTGPRTPLPGAHPVIAHSVCTGDSSIASLWVMQSVMRTDSVTSQNDLEFLQRFRVPRRTRLHWVEIAESPGSNLSYSQLSWLSVIDPAGATTPPLTLPAYDVSAYLPIFWPTAPGWSSNNDFDSTVVLEPAHDYWLLVHTNFNHRLWTRALTGTEDANFTSHVGPLWTRATDGAAWSTNAGHVLDFRLVGEDLGDASVPPSTPLGRLELRALENPAHGATMFAWAGAHGTPRFEVLDVRGRRVGGGEAGAGDAGRWLWTALRSDGAPLPAGVYFVRATDGAGASATERVVLVR